MLRLAFIACVFVTSFAVEASESEPKPEDSSSAWHFDFNEDKMTGDKSWFAQADSMNRLSGLTGSESVSVIYLCGRGFVVATSKFSFATDNIDCSKARCRHIQYGRVKFDDGPAKEANFILHEESYAMYLVKGTYVDQVAYWLDKMKTADTMYLELELTNTKGKQQIAEFSLNGASDAINRCP